MGHGTMVPRMRAGTLRRTLDAEAEAHRGTIAELSRTRAKLAEAERLCGVKDDALRLAQERIDALERDASAAPFLMDMIAERDTRIVNFSSTTTHPEEE